MFGLCKMSLKETSFRTLALCMLSSATLTPALAQQVPTTKGVSVTKSVRSVPVINIAAPNASGVSHNIYSKFDVQETGVILNNSTQAGTSAIGGRTLQNSNLRGGAASLIINEVQGAPSQLKGKLEVFGKTASILIANPNGISCDGCSFSNVWRVSLAAAKPEFSAGNLSLVTSKCNVGIYGRGLNAANVEYFDIVGGYVTIKGAINSK